VENWVLFRDAGDWERFAAVWHPDGWMTAVVLLLDPDLLGRFPEGYRHLAYLQSKIGLSVKGDLPGLHGLALEKLYAEGKAWLDGSERPGIVF
jgi:hypothetical protein